MCSAKRDVDPLIRKEVGDVGIGEMEINEWSELLTNEQEIGMTHHVPVSLASITHHSKKINGKFKRGDGITSSWEGKKFQQIIDTRHSTQQRANEYYVTNTNGVSSFDSLSPPQLPPKSSNISSNLYINGHTNNLNTTAGTPYSTNNIISPTSADWIEMKSTNHTNFSSTTSNVSSSSHGAMQRNGINLSTTTPGNNGNTYLRPPPPPPSTASLQKNLNVSSATVLPSSNSRKMSSASSSSLSSSSVSSTMALAVSSSLTSTKGNCISTRRQHQDLPNINIPIHSNPQRAISSSSSTGVSPTSSSSSSSVTVGSSPLGILQPPSHSPGSSTFVPSRDCNGISSEADQEGSCSNNLKTSIILPPVHKNHAYQNGF